MRDRRYTDRSVEGVYTESYSCGRVSSSSGHMSVYMYSIDTGRIKEYTECDVEVVCTDFVYLVDNDNWFLPGITFAGFLFFIRCYLSNI